MAEVLMRVMTLALLCALPACGATMMRPARTHSPYAPINEGQGGQVKYLADGAQFVVEARRKDAYKQMYESCGGPYRIAEEHTEQQGSASGATVSGEGTYGAAVKSTPSGAVGAGVAKETATGYGWTVPINYQVITFECGEAPSRGTEGDVDAGDELARFVHRFVVVTLRDGQTVAGKFVRLGDAELTIVQVDGSRVDLPRSEVSRVAER